MRKRRREPKNMAGGFWKATTSWVWFKICVWDDGPNSCEDVCLCCEGKECVVKTRRRWAELWLTEFKRLSKRQLWSLKIGQLCCWTGYICLSARSPVCGSILNWRRIARHSHRTSKPLFTHGYNFDLVAWGHMHDHTAVRDSLCSQVWGWDTASQLSELLSGRSEMMLSVSYPIMKSRSCGCVFG